MQTQADRRSNWHTIEAIALIVLGILAVLTPIFAGAAIALVLGVLLAISGAVGLISAFSGGRHAHVGWSLVSAGVALVVGLVLIFYPVAGAAALALILGVYLFLDGISLIGLALDHRRRGDRAWVWLLVTAILDLALALLIAIMGGLAKASLIGFIVGLDLILAGSVMLALHRPFSLSMLRPGGNFREP